MAGDFDPAINRLVDEINKDEAALQEKKRMVNTLCSYASRAPMYLDAEKLAKTVGAILPDQFYGKPLATATREYLEMRRASNLGAANIKEIFENLQAGGFKFETKNEANAMRGLRQSLTKNSVTFHKLPNGTYGLLEWYPNAKPQKDKPTDDEEPSAGSTNSSDAPEPDEDEGESEH
jgi:hypothetical protein